MDATSLMLRVSVLGEGGQNVFYLQLVEFVASMRAPIHHHRVLSVTSIPFDHEVLPPPRENLVWHLQHVRLNRFLDFPPLYHVTESIGILHDLKILLDRRGPCLATSFEPDVFVRGHLDVVVEPAGLHNTGVGVGESESFDLAV